MTLHHQTISLAEPMKSLRPYQRFLDRLWPRSRQIRRGDYLILGEIRKRAAVLEKASQDEFRRISEELKQLIQIGSNSALGQYCVVESFALTSEALRRTTGKVYYDCQLLAGLVLATGAIAEMQTGEGKTITCGLPAVLYGMTGAGVHVATTNAYLAKRDYEELLPIFEMLGLTAALVVSEQDKREKQIAYAQDIIYGTGYEFGFDFLRDQLALRNKIELPLGTRFLSRLRGIPTQEIGLMQRELGFAIIDEADSVLIDEATTPLILSGSSGSIEPVRQVYHYAMSQADQLIEDDGFEIDAINKSIRLTERGWRQVHEQLTPQIQLNLQRPWNQYIEQALYASHLLKRDVDYVARDDQVVLVDQNTGRIHEERKWRSGLHQAIEIRENVTLTEEREIEARITRQRYFGFYDRIAGMTGTAAGNEGELVEFYRLPVVEIARNKPSQRRTTAARYFSGREFKHVAIAKDVLARSQLGQPVLVGTRTITQSRELSSLLEKWSLPHLVLNGTQDHDEAEIISRAGAPGAVTIATNMAGRGTDIRIDGHSRDAGGLHVVVVEHHDSPRVDRQLIGRCARQSDPGSCQFFVSADDEIIRRYDPKLANTIMRAAGRDGECTATFDFEVASLQKRIERINFGSRKKMVVQDHWIESVQESVAKTA